MKPATSCAPSLGSTSIPPRVRRYRRVGNRLARLIERDGGERCYFCRERFDLYGRRSNIDHLLPIARGGTNDLSNLALVCHTCNKRKGSLTADEFVASAYFVKRRAQVDAQERRAMMRASAEVWPGPSLASA